MTAKPKSCVAQKLSMKDNDSYPWKNRGVLFSVHHRPSWSIEISPYDRLLDPSFECGSSFSQGAPLHSQPQF